MPDRIRLDGKVAVVTGAAGVIGTATMRLLAERGARIVAIDRKAPDLQTAVKGLPASAQALAITADVTSEDEVADYVRAAVDKFGGIDVLVNNAGYGHLGFFEENTPADVEAQFETNVIGLQERKIFEDRFGRLAGGEVGQDMLHRNTLADFAPHHRLTRVVGAFLPLYLRPFAVS